MTMVNEETSGGHRRNDDGSFTYYCTPLEKVMFEAKESWMLWLENTRRANSKEPVLPSPSRGWNKYVTEGVAPLHSETISNRIKGYGHMMERFKKDGVPQYVLNIWNGRVAEAENVARKIAETKPVGKKWTEFHLSTPTVPDGGEWAGPQTSTVDRPAVNPEDVAKNVAKLKEHLPTPTKPLFVFDEGMTLSDHTHKFIEKWVTQRADIENACAVINAVRLWELHRKLDSRPSMAELDSHYPMAHRAARGELEREQVLRELRQKFAGELVDFNEFDLLCVKQVTEGRFKGTKTPPPDNVYEYSTRKPN